MWCIEYRLCRLGQNDFECICDEGVVIHDATCTKLHNVMCPYINVT
jgi:hypothetical protein